MNAFNILNDPVRRRILEHLYDRAMASGEVVKVVGDEFSISQSAISQHLKVLRNNGFATVRVKGTRRIYELKTTGLKDLDRWLEPFRKLWDPKLKSLAKETKRGKKNRKN